MFKIISNPITRFDELLKNPDWQRPLIVFLIITAVAAILATYFYALPNRESLLTERDLTEEQLERAQKFMESPIAIILGPISAAVMTVIRILVFTLFFYLSLSLIEVKKPFKEILNITANSALIGTIGYIIKIPLLIATAKQPTTGLSLFVLNNERNTFLFKFLDRIDLFAGWEVVVLIIGLSMLVKIEWKRIAVVVIPCWILYNVVMATLGGPR